MPGEVNDAPCDYAALHDVKTDETGKGGSQRIRPVISWMLMSSITLLLRILLSAHRYFLLGTLGRVKMGGIPFRGLTDETIGV